MPKRLPTGMLHAVEKVSAMWNKFVEGPSNNFSRLHVSCNNSCRLLASKLSSLGPLTSSYFYPKNNAHLSNFDWHPVGPYCQIWNITVACICKAFHLLLMHGCSL